MGTFSEKEYLRYSRHLSLPQVGAAGQTTLKNSRVLIVGCGGLGAPVSLYLAAAGVGTITVVDDDTIELSNLQRQVTFSEADIGGNKADVTRQRLLALNSDIHVASVCKHLSPDNAQTLISDSDIVLDCTDNFSTRYLINDVCKQLKKPWIYASIYQFSGQCALFAPDSSCFRCLYPNAPDNLPDCNTGGVLGVLPGILGTVQATECIKYLLKIDRTAQQRLLMIETLDMGWQNIKLAQDPSCPCCFPEQLNAVAATPSPSTQKFSQKEHSPLMKEIIPQQFAALASDSSITVIDVRTPEEFQAFNLADHCYKHLHIPLNELADQIRNETLDLAQERSYLVYCQAGGRSAQAVALLGQLGYDATNVAGGVQAVIQQ